MGVDGQETSLTAAEDSDVPVSLFRSPLEIEGMDPRGREPGALVGSTASVYTPSTRKDRSSADADVLRRTPRTTRPGRSGFLGHKRTPAN